MRYKMFKCKYSGLNFILAKIIRQGICQICLHFLLWILQYITFSFGKQKSGAYKYLKRKLKSLLKNQFSNTKMKHEDMFFCPEAWQAISNYPCAVNKGLILNPWRIDLFRNKISWCKFLLMSMKFEKNKFTFSIFMSVILLPSNDYIYI